MPKQDTDGSAFLIRLEEVARGRVLTTWLRDFGWSATDVNRVRGGHVPGPDKLIPLAVRENVSLTWLLTGVGPAYVGQGGWIAFEPDRAPIRAGNRADLVTRIDALPEAAVDALLRLVKLIPP